MPRSRRECLEVRITIKKFMVLTTIIVGIYLYLFCLFPFLNKKAEGPTSFVFKGRRYSFNDWYRIFEDSYMNDTCVIAAVNLKDKGFQEISERDNLRGYTPNCMPSTWRLFDSDLDSILVRKQRPAEFWDTVDCCYRSFQRQIDSDVNIDKSNLCVPITTEKTYLTVNEEFIHIECKDKNSTKVIYSDLIGFVPLKPDVVNRINGINSGDNLPYNKTNVVILGLDAVSQYNFLRYLPKTHDYLMNNMSAIQFSKYHRTDGYSFDNMVTFHMGLTRKEIVDVCYPDKKSYLDSCPLIWKEFAARGFITSYAEDAVDWSIFWYKGECNGFVKQPTDYDLRTLTRRMEYFEGYSEPTPSVCYGDKLTHEVVFENIIKTAITLKGLPYFQFSWACALTHNVPIMTKYMGDSVINMFEQLQSRDLLQNTVFILLADHGMNFGPPRKTAQGSVEVNMPIFYMIFPKWFSNKYPRAMRNLEMNSDTLTSHFDAYETLKDFVDLGVITDSALEEREFYGGYQNRRGISLFLPIPKERTCSMAGILPEFCSCWRLRPVAVDNPIVLSVLDHLENQINTELEKNPSCKTYNFVISTVNSANCSHAPTLDGNAYFNSTETQYAKLGVDVQCRILFTIAPIEVMGLVSVQKNHNESGWTTLETIYKSSSSKITYDHRCIRRKDSWLIQHLCDCILA